MSEEQDQYITSTDLRKYRIELPNLYDDSGLGVYEFRLLCHYVRRGHTYESVRTTAKHCNMSHPMVIKTRDRLMNKGFIKTWQDINSGTINVRVVDKWLENFQKYSGHTVERGGHTVERGGHTVELKKEPFKKEPVKKVFSEFTKIFGKIKGDQNGKRLAKLAITYGDKTMAQVIAWASEKEWSNQRQLISGMKTAASNWESEAKITPKKDDWKKQYDNAPA